MRSENKLSILFALLAVATCPSYFDFFRFIGLFGFTWFSCFRRFCWHGLVHYQVNLVHFTISRRFLNTLLNAYIYRVAHHHYLKHLFLCIKDRCKHKPDLLSHLKLFVPCHHSNRIPNLNICHHPVLTYP